MGSVNQYAQIWDRTLESSVHPSPESLPYNLRQLGGRHKESWTKKMAPCHGFSLIVDIQTSKLWKYLSDRFDEHIVAPRPLQLTQWEVVSPRHQLQICWVGFGFFGSWSLVVLIDFGDGVVAAKAWSGCNETLPLSVVGSNMYRYGVYPTVWLASVALPPQHRNYSWYDMAEPS